MSTDGQRVSPLLRKLWSGAGRSLGGLRLSSRIVLVSVLLLLLVQLAGFTVIRESIDRNAHRQLADRLVLGERIWQRLLEQRAAKLSQGAAVLAADYGLREAVSSHDEQTLRSALDNHAGRIGATLAAVLAAGASAQQAASADPAEGLRDD